MEGKIIDFMLDTGAQNSLFLNVDGSITGKKIFVSKGHRGKAQLMDYPKNSGFRTRLNNSFIYGDSRKPISLAGP